MRRISITIIAALGLISAPGHAPAQVEGVKTAQPESSERRVIFALFGFVADFSARIERVRGVARVFSPGSGPPCGAMA